MEFVDEIASLSPDSVNTTDASSEYTQDDQGNIQRLIRLTLNDLFKEDLQKGFLDSASRKYLYDQADLNEDGNSEIIVGLTGPYFCGSGGCTMLVLSNHGDVITRFSVVKYPIFIDEETTNGWKNLILFSGSENRLVTYDGQTYPSNPSTLEIYSGSFEGLDKLLDWEKNEVLGF
ncbi:hypothetical protein [uncultured Algoriphagus sp.]|uniref:hypothetical protein n=1 Tax=uncultured Algoriphagus sp. TaxID=417365 RepID=UPI0025898A60|nr:hypothetical protein [uncultured Algoriphagus sp.]